MLIKAPRINKINYRKDIDGLRAIAVVIVILYHMKFKFFTGGYIGVDIFFVISGYLITKIIVNELLNTKDFSFKNFYSRRINRLLPALLSTLIFTTLASLLILSSSHLIKYGKSLLYSLLSVSNLYFWSEINYFDISAYAKPLLHTWSLSIEEQFYFLWPSFLFLISRPFKGKLLLFFIFLSLIISFASNFLLISNFDLAAKNFPSTFTDLRSTLFFMLPFRVFEFSIGALVIFFETRITTNKLFSNLLCIGSIIAIILSTHFFDEQLIFPSYYALAPAIATSLLILTIPSSSIKFLLENYILVHIGKISYSLYLIHWPVIVFSFYLFNTLSHPQTILILVITYLFSIFNYNYIEQPFRLKKFNLSSKAPQFFMLSSYLLLLISGFALNSSDGLKWRIQNVLNFEDVGDSNKFHKQYYGGTGYFGPIKTTNPADIVLIGDSRARHYAEGIFKLISAPYNLNFYVSEKPSCIHLPNFTKSHESRDYSKLCPRGLKRGLDFIKNGNNPLVIMSASWINQMQKADLLDSNGKAMKIKITTKEIINGILKLKSLIGKSKLLIIGQVPESDVNLYDFFTRPHFFTSLNINDYIRSNAKTEFLKFNSELKKASVETKNFFFLDPHDVLCNKENQCLNIDEQKRLIYTDTGHLSKSGSIKIIKGFKNKILKILKR